MIYYRFRGTATCFNTRVYLIITIGEFVEIINKQNETVIYKYFKILPNVGAQPIRHLKSKKLIYFKLLLLNVRLKLGKNQVA